MEIIEFEDRYAEDLKELARLALESVDIDYDKYSTVGEGLELDYVKKVYIGRNRFWLAIERDKLVGSVGLSATVDDPKTGELKRMFVAPKFQGKGIGQSLMDNLLLFARANNYERIVLDTDKKMEGAHRFYEKNGFKKTGEHGVVAYYELNLL